MSRIARTTTITTTTRPKASTVLVPAVLGSPLFPTVDFEASALALGFVEAGETGRDACVVTGWSFPTGVLVGGSERPRVRRAASRRTRAGSTAAPGVGTLGPGVAVTAGDAAGGGAPVVVGRERSKS